MVDDSPPENLSARKRSVFTVIMVLIVVLVCEVLSAITLWSLSLPLPPPGSPTPTHPEDPNKPLYGIEVVHPYLGYVLDNEEQTLTHTPINYYGFPNAPGGELQKRSNDTVIVAIFGGSVAMKIAGSGLQALEKSLREYPPYKEKKFTYVTFALGGYKQPQQLMALSYFLMLGSEFDIAINLDGFNEMAMPLSENIPRQIFPAFPRSWALRFSEKMQLEKGAITYLNQKRAEWYGRYNATPLRLSRTFTLLWALLDRNMSEKIERRRYIFTMEEFPATMSGTTYLQSGPAYPMKDLDTMRQDLSDIWSNSSWQMHLLSQANGIKYFHFLQPNQYVAGSKPMSAEERKTAIVEGEGYGQWIPEGYPYLQRAGEELRSKGVQFYDMTMVFHTVEEPLYWDNCCHFNEKGAEILAEAMGRAIVHHLTPSPL